MPRPLVDAVRARLASTPFGAQVLGRIGSATSRNMSWLLADRMFRLALGFLVGAWVARYLGPAHYGKIAYMIALIAFVQPFVTLSADALAVRDLVQDRDTAPELLGTLFALRAGLGLAFWAGVVVLQLILDPSNEEQVLFVLIAGSSLIFQSADTIDLWFQSNLQSRKTIIPKLSAYCVSSTIKVALILAHAPTIAFVCTSALEAALAAGGMVMMLRSDKRPDRWTRTAARARRILLGSWPFMVSALSITVYMRIDQIMLKALSGDTEVGLFAAGAPINAIIQTVGGTILVGLAPVVARRKVESAEAYDRMMLWIYRVALVATLAVCIAVALLSPFIIRLLFGPAFAGAAAVLSIQVFANVFVSLGLAQNLWIVNENAGRLNIAKTLAGAVVAVAGNAVFIPLYGARGAAAVTVMSYCTSAMLANIVLAPRVFLMQLGFDPGSARRHV